MADTQDFPVGGPREAVFKALRQRGFVMAGSGDKLWTRGDGLNTHIYGSGSQLRVNRGGLFLYENSMAASLAFIDSLDKQTSAS